MVISFDLDPNGLFTNKDKEHKKTSEEVKAIDDSEESFCPGEKLTVLTLIMVNCMNTFATPQDSKNKEELSVESLR